MAIRNILKLNDEMLRKKCKNVLAYDENLWALLDDMKQTMHHNNGMGLAAPQIGVMKRIAVIESNNMFLELINPVIVSQEGEDIETEACLSIPERREWVKRPMCVTVTACDRLGYEFTITGEKYLARVLCHEIDHLDGVLFIDRAIKNYSKKGV